jgi:hypothetical protein
MGPELSFKKWHASVRANGEALGKALDPEEEEVEETHYSLNAGAHAVEVQVDDDNVPTDIKTTISITKPRMSKLRLKAGHNQ